MIETEIKVLEVKWLNIRGYEEVLVLLKFIFSGLLVVTWWYFRYLNDNCYAKTTQNYM